MISTCRCFSSRFDMWSNYNSTTPKTCVRYKDTHARTHTHKWIYVTSRHVSIIYSVHIGENDENHIHELPLHPYRNGDDKYRTVVCPGTLNISNDEKTFLDFLVILKYSFQSYQNIFPRYYIHSDKFSMFIFLTTQ